MNNTTKYGNSTVWCFIEDKWSGKEVAIWRGQEGSEEIFCRASNKYEAKNIIDALLKHSNTDTNGLSTKELAFLEFVCAHCIEPYATMASNAILWKDHAAYEDLKNKFSTIY